MFLLLVYLFVAIVVSFLCSILEAALLSVPRAHVETMVREGSPAGERLAAMKSDIDRPLSAILTLNTIAHTVGAAGAGAQAAAVFGSQWLGVASAILTLLVLVFSEIVPKKLGVVYAKPLAGFTAVTTSGLVVMLWPIVKPIELLNRVISGPQDRASVSRAELHAITRLGEEEGVIDESESRVMRNLLALRNTAVNQIMTPRKVVFALQEDQTVGEVVDPSRPLQFARMPLYAKDMDGIVGVITRYDIFQAYHTGKQQRRLNELARDIHVIPEHASVADAIEQFLQRRSQLSQVVDEYGGTAGVVTLEDCVETLLGVEIVDETDRVEDMRDLARRLLSRQQRDMARRRDAKDHFWLDRPESDESQD